MKLTKITFLGIFTGIAMFAFGAGSASAQATRTWVSGVGDDANPCSRTAPCKTFAGAISKTAAGGEIDCLDPGGFGGVTITKAITIDCGGVTGGVLVAGTNGIVINAGVNDKIILRNLAIFGVGTGLNGIRFLAGAQLSVVNVTIDGFTGNAIDVAKSATGELYVTDTYITKANKGIVLSTTGGFITAAITNTTIVNMTTNGFETASNNIFATVSGSTLVSAGSNGVVVSSGNGLINLSSSVVANNATGVNAVSSGSTIRISDNLIYNNTNDLARGAGATLASDTSNKTGPSSGATTNGTITLR